VRGQREGPKIIDFKGVHYPLEVILRAVFFYICSRSYTATLKRSWLNGVSCLPCHATLLGGKMLYGRSRRLAPLVFPEGRGMKQRGGHRKNRVQDHIFRIVATFKINGLERCLYYFVASIWQN
jgi:hypothetical protein